MASIHKAGKGWRVTWREGGKQKTKRWATKRDAAEFVRELEAAAPPVVRGRMISMDDAAKGYLMGRRGWAGNPEWYDKDKRTLARAIKRGGWQSPRDVLPVDLEALPVGEFRLVKAALRWAARAGVQVAAGCLTARAPAKDRDAKPYLVTKAEASAALGAALTWGVGEGLAVHLVATYGHRPQSIAQLRPANYDAERRQLTLAIKSGNTHRHPVTPETHGMIMASAQGCGDGYLIRPHNGREWGRGSPLVSWYYRVIGKVHHPHDPGIYALKRFAIVRMFDLGLSPETIASITGHRTTSLLLNTYARTNEERQGAAVSALGSLLA